MPHYRLTVRHGTPQRYHVVDLEAADLAAAVAQAAQHVPRDDADADLLEIRRQADPAQRAYVGED